MSISKKSPSQTISKTTSNQRAAGRPSRHDQSFKSRRGAKPGQWRETLTLIRRMEKEDPSMNPYQIGLSLGKNGRWAYQFIRAAEAEKENPAIAEMLEVCPNAYIQAGVLHSLTDNPELQAICIQEVKDGRDWVQEIYPRIRTWKATKLASTGNTKSNSVSRSLQATGVLAGQLKQMSSGVESVITKISKHKINAKDWNSIIEPQIRELSTRIKVLEQLKPE